MMTTYHEKANYTKDIYPNAVEDKPTNSPSSKGKRLKLFASSMPTMVEIKLLGGPEQEY